MFINLEKKCCLVVGGGSVALRKVQVLLDFGAEVVVVAPQILAQIKKLSENGVSVIERAFEKADLEGCVLVVAATDDKEQNHAVAQLAKEKKILVNAVDQKEDCTFIFPSYIRQQDLVGAFSSGGSSPLLTQYLKEQFAQILTPELGQINTYMGSVRETVKARVPDERLRKKAYQKILAQMLSDMDEGMDVQELSNECFEKIIFEILHELMLKRKRSENGTD